MATKDFYETYFSHNGIGNGPEIPTVPHTLESPFTPRERLISKRGAVCAVAAACSCLGGGVGFGSLIPKEDHMPLVLQLQEEIERKNQKITELTELALETDDLEILRLQKELESKNKSITELAKLALEDDENNSLLNKVVNDNEFRKTNQEEQNKEILKLQGEKQALTLQVDKQLQEITKLKKSLEDEAKKFIKKAFKKLCEKGNWVGVGRGYNRKFSTAECKKVAEEV